MAADLPSIASEVINATMPTVNEFQPKRNNTKIVKEELWDLTKSVLELGDLKMRDFTVFDPTKRVRYAQNKVLDQVSETMNDSTDVNSEKFKNAVILELYKQLSEADSDIDSNIISDLEEMQNNWWISTAKLKEEFWDELINPVFIGEMKDNSFLNKWVQYENISQEAIDAFLAQTSKTLSETRKISKEYSDLTKEIEKITESIWG